MSKVEDVLQDRGSQYGPFSSQAHITQCLKSTVYGKGVRGLSDVEKEALDMILHKIARIVNGSGSHHDSWIDIAGYATLVVNDIESNQDKE